MSAQATHICDLPLLVAGIPPRAGNWLREAGVPIAPLPARAAADAKRKACRRFVLFDSRDAVSRREAAAVASRDLAAIDVAGCLARAAGGLADAPHPDREAATEIWRPSRARFLSCLKDEVERAGGIWACISEFPFPWHCEPGLWTSHGAELAAWHATRLGLRLQLARRQEAYQLQVSGKFGGFRPVLELWRGRHVACFELRPGETHLPFDGLVYQLADRAHCGDDEPGAFDPSTPSAACSQTA